MVLQLLLLPLYLSGALGLGGHAARNGNGFSFDINSGPQKQRDTSTKDARDVEFSTDGGTPFHHPYETQRIGADGPLLLQDVHLTELFGAFDRERIPERVVHAKGAGAHGYFEVTNAEFAKKYTMMDVFSENGLKTPITVRFSTVGGESGSADEARDPRGFAMKFRTRKGIWDLVMNNTPVFFIRDPSKFPHFIHTQKRNPHTHLKDKNMFWDYLSSNPESVYQAMRLFSDLGTPYGFTHMDAWSGHTYRWIKEGGEWVYVRIYAESHQGVKNFTNAEATKMQGENPDFATQDLYERIEKGDYPGWTMYAQILTPSDAQKFKYNVLDLTKQWFAEDVKPVEIGKFYLTQNPSNYFAEIEQAAFSPSKLVEGWGPSADPVLQARLFSYADTQRYRLGVNYQQIPVNCPLNAVANFERDGAMNVLGNQGARPNYLSTMDPIKLPVRPYIDDTHQKWTGGAVSSLAAITEIDFDCPRRFWKSLSQKDKDCLISNLVGHLGQASDEGIRKRQVALFNHVDSELGKGVAKGVGVTIEGSLEFGNGPTWYNTTKEAKGSTVNY
ncbi:catalase-domain-containing protein [Flagelloscypha sp. PMI_526]|nr:catalase-domain-containing protein [Flagelloscypha sp. PMI_526]